MLYSNNQCKTDSSLPNMRKMSNFNGSRLSQSSKMYFKNQREYMKQL